MLRKQKRNGHIQKLVAYPCTKRISMNEFHYHKVSKDYSASEGIRFVSKAKYAVNNFTNTNLDI